MSADEPKAGDDGRGDEDKEPIPKLPRGRFFSRLAMVDLFRIAMFAILLVIVLFLRRPCADGVANFFEAVTASSADAGPTLRYQHLTDEQIRQRFGGGQAPASKDAGNQAF